MPVNTPITPTYFAGYMRRTQEICDYMLSKTQLESNDQRYGYLVGVVAEMLRTGSVEDFRRELEAFKRGIV